MHAPQMTMRDWIMLVALAVIWGGAFFFARIAVLEVPPFTLVFLRVFLAALALNFFLMLISSNTRHSAQLWQQFAMMGLLNNVIPFSLLFFGQKELGAGLASIVNAMVPIWSLLIAHFATHDEKLSSSKLVGIVLSLAGVGSMIGGAVFAGLSTVVWALLAVAGATISYGVASVYGRIFATTPPLETARGQLTMSSLMMLPVMLFADQPWLLPMPSVAAAGSVVILALVCTAFAYILFFRILASAGAVNISLVTMLVPASAILLGTIFLGEVLLLRHIMGLGLIIAGLAVIDGRPLRRLVRLIGG